MKDLIFAICATCLCSLFGCTVVLSESNDSYIHNAHKQFEITGNQVPLDVFQMGSVRYYKLDLKETSYYVMADNNNLTLVENLPHTATKIGRSMLHLMPKDSFDPTKLDANNADFPVHIYLITETAKVDVSTSDQYVLYYSTKNGVKKHDPVDNALSPSASQYAVSVLRNAGYLVSVPADIAATPLYAGLFLMLACTWH